MRFYSKRGLWLWVAFCLIAGRAFAGPLKTGITGNAVKPGLWGGVIPRGAPDLVPGALANDFRFSLSRSPAAVPVSLAEPPALPAQAVIGAAAADLKLQADADGAPQTVLETLQDAVPEGRDARDDPARLDELYSKGKKSAEDAAAPYDLNRRPLHQDDKISLLLSGYRMDAKAGRILVPNREQPLTVEEVAALKISLNFRRNLDNMAWLSHMRNDAEAGGRSIASVLALHKDVLAREVGSAWKKGKAAFRKAVLKRYASLFRRAYLRPSLEEFKTLVSAPQYDGDGYFDDAERKNGERIQQALIARLGANPEGAKLLEELRGPDGQVRLPAVLVLDIDDRYAAFYNPNRVQLVLKGDPSALTDADIEEFVAQRESSIFHELVHYAQDLHRGYFAASKRGEVPGLATLENEFEAFGRQNLYIHEALRLNPAKTDDPQLSRYLTWLMDFYGWRDEIVRSYGDRWPSTYSDLPGVGRLHEEIGRISRKVARADPERAKLLRLAHMRGSAALRREAAAFAPILDDLRLSQERARLEGLLRWARINQEKGNWQQALYAFDHARKAAPAERRAELDAKFQDAATQAMVWLHGDEHGLDLDARLVLVDAIARAYNEASRSWPDQLWVLRARTFSEAAEHNRSLAREQRSAAERDRFLENARTWLREIEKDRAILRQNAQTRLAEYEKEQDPARKAALLDWLGMWARNSGDEALVARVGALQAPVEDKSFLGRLFR
ncbi:MAG: hypothetical protein PHF00_13860 [Elusimicrobia bacterium]|nr:hypothetical protein [Elusimicrobiota bacterium]